MTEPSVVQLLSSKDKALLVIVYTHLCMFDLLWPSGCDHDRDVEEIREVCSDVTIRRGVYALLSGAVTVPRMPEASGL